MKRVLCVLSCLPLVLVLTACEHSQPSPSTAVSATSSLATAATAPASQGVRLSVVPGEVGQCQSRDHIVSTVSWTVIDADIPHVKVMVSDPDSSHFKLFSAGGFKGTATTGDWVVVGTRFTLVNAETGKQLATYTVKSAPCKVMK